MRDRSFKAIKFTLLCKYDIITVLNLFGGELLWGLISKSFFGQ